MRKSDHFDSKNDNEYSGLDSLAPGIFLLDENGIVRYCNERLLRRIEASFESICGQSIKAFIPDFPVNVDAYGFGTDVATTAAEPQLIRLQLQNGGAAMVRFTARPLLRKGISSLVVIIEEIKSTVAETGGRDIVSLMTSAKAKVDAMPITDRLHN